MPEKSPEPLSEKTIIADNKIGIPILPTIFQRECFIIRKTAYNHIIRKIVWLQSN
jgi:hypothetical protein